MTNGGEEDLAHSTPPITEITLIETEILPDGRGEGILMTSIQEKKI